jgi:valyl-tRNA synthetase
MNLSLERVASNRNFSNKIWNATRFVVNSLSDDFDASSKAPDLSQLALPERWIVSRLHQLVAEVTRLFDDYNFGEAGRQTYEFFWNEYADWYIEIAKIALTGDDPAARKATQQVLVYVLDQTLRLLHPYIPFVTEAAWQHLPHQGDALMLAPWPTAGATDEAAEADMNLLMTMIRTVRNARSENKVEPSRRITAQIAAGEKEALIEAQQSVLVNLARLDEESLVIAGALAEKPADALTMVVEGGVEIYLPLAGLVDLEAEQQRLQSEAADLEKRIAGSQKTLANENFVSKAPAQVVERERAKLADLETQLAKIESRLQVTGS